MTNPATTQQSGAIPTQPGPREAAESKEAVMSADATVPKPGDTVAAPGDAVIAWAGDALMAGADGAVIPGSQAPAAHPARGPP